jgi:hypothetical protein
MGTYDNQPGGGYQEQKGYVPPAGSMADEQRRQREDDARRAQQESMQRQQEALRSQERDRASVDRQIEERRASMKSGGATRGGPSTKGGTGKVGSAPARGASARSVRAPVAQRPWHPLFGSVGFLATTLLVGSKMTGENKWILAVAIGLAAGAIIGRLWKPMLVLGAIGLGVWLWARTPRQSSPGVGATFEGSPSAAATPSGPSSWFTPSPRPVEVGVVMPEFVPAVIPGDPPRAVASSVLADHPRRPPANADYRVETTVLKPGEAVVRATRFDGKPAIVVHHTPPLGYEVITQVEYVPATGYVWAHLTDGKAYGLGIQVPVEERDLWLEAEYVGFVRDEPNVQHELRSIPLTRS